MVHGFPDFWYSWRAQMPALAKKFHVVAIDQRGYNLSGQPEGVENYKTDKLVGDLVAVVKHFGPGKAVIVGHDWGGMVAWTFAMTHPELTDRLIVLNLPHPRGLMRELATNPQQQKNSQYARDFQKPDAAKHVTADVLTFWVKDPEARKVYRAALKRSSMEGMLNYYKANYPRISPDDRDRADAKPAMPAMPNVKCPVLLIHGLKDTGPPSRAPQRYLELDRQRPDAGDDPRGRPFRSAGCRRSGHPDDGRLAEPLTSSTAVAARRRFTSSRRLSTVSFSSLFSRRRCSIRISGVTAGTFSCPSPARARRRSRRLQPLSHGTRPGGARPAAPTRIASSRPRASPLASRASAGVPA